MNRAYKGKINYAGSFTNQHNRRCEVCGVIFQAPRVIHTFDVMKKEFKCPKCRKPTR